MKKMILMMATVLTTLQGTAQSLQYPMTQKDDTVDTYFGTKVADPYRWLENDTSKQTKQWVEAENSITQAYLKKIPFRKKIIKRLNQVFNYEKVSMPSKEKGKWYLAKNDGLQNQSVIYVMDELGGEQRVFLDPNKLSSDGTVALKGIFHSNNGKWAAYAISRSGSDWSEFYVIDMKTGQLTDDHIEWAKFSGASWLGDGFFYSAYDRPDEGKEFSNVNANHKIYYHKIGTNQSEDILFYQNPAYPMRFYGVEVNEEETMMFLYESGAGSGFNIFVRDLRQPNSQFIQMTRDMDFEYSVFLTEEDKIYIKTNYNAPKGHIMVADLKNPGIDSWKELIAEGNNVLTGAQVIGGQMFLTYQKDASDRAFVYSKAGKLIQEIQLPTMGNVSFSGRKDEPECFYSFSSFTQPSTVYQYDSKKNISTVYTTPKVNFKPNDFVTEQVFFNSKDDTKIPAFMVYKKGLKKNSKNPVYLYGYGGFNISLTPSFIASMIPFLENGGIYVQVTLRGGNEYGEEWHKAGTKLQKQNVFDDFIGAAEWLIKENYTDSKHIAIVGGSNGGLLVGACMTQRPELFGVAIPRVGVMDMLRYHKFTIGWNWAPDYGTSDDSKEMFEYLKAYSPLHNLKNGTSYPATLVTTADHDDRVVPAHSFKFAATLQECHKGEAPVLIRIDSKAGHGGGKPMSKVIEEYADIHSFILYNMELKFK